MKVLLIEDNSHKKELIDTFLKEQFADIEINLKRSYNSGLREIVKNQDYNLILLDMSLPNYDIEPGETGGDFENAGELILKEMYRRDIGVNVVIVTMYHNYIDEQNNWELKQAFKNYLGVIYFDLNYPDSWKKELTELIRDNYDKNISC